jgi:hypothetical protein
MQQANNRETIIKKKAKHAPFAEISTNKGRIQ